jgi:aryl-alcohol dehydrogenase-like predicted oxidoreductase
MNYRLLGRSGLRVSEVALGTMTFGEEWGWGASADEARKVYERFREAGGNFVDTANVYTNGTSERFVGEFVKGHRGEVVLATKYTNASLDPANPPRDPNAGGNARKNMVQAVEASLKRLGTDYLDLYWMHIWDGGLTPVEEVMRGFDDLVRAGKILYAGVSDTPAWWVAQANTLADLRGWTRFVGLQIEYSLAERTVERELLPMAGALGLTITAWGALAGGVLSGKYRRGEGAGARYSTPMMQSAMPAARRNDRIVDAVGAVAHEVDRSPAQVALAWLRTRPVPVIPILGARRIQQLEDNLASLTLSLSPAQVTQLDEASSVELGFPNDLYRREMIGKLLHAGMRDRILA